MANASDLKGLDIRFRNKLHCSTRLDNIIMIQKWLLLKTLLSFKLIVLFAVRGHVHERDSKSITIQEEQKDVTTVVNSLLGIYLKLIAISNLNLHRNSSKLKICDLQVTG